MIYNLIQGSVRVQSTSNRFYNFKVFPLEAISELNAEGIYILVVLDESGQFNYIYKSMGMNMREDLLSDEVQKIMGKKNPTHILVKFPFTKTNLQEAWDDIKDKIIQIKAIE